MSFKHVVGGGGCGGYAIRSFIAASRLELRTRPVWTRKGFATTSVCSLPRQNVRRRLATNVETDQLSADSPTAIDLDKPAAFNNGNLIQDERQDEARDVKTTISTEAFDAINEKSASNSAHESALPAEDESVEFPPSLSDKQQESSLPWYLQIDSPQAMDANPFAARQQLPPLPTHPPPILEPLLQHVSVDLGMDDLSLLDLRELDPPAALGANLLMLLGTARSEKHLHVSADRFCRWLRSEYGLAPFADGLLGRNELKLKLRRKAKRSRLMSAVGTKETGPVAKLDDGIRTGWVCVNVGTVEGGVLPSTAGGDGAVGGQDFVGFRDEVKGTRIVVQLMTDERRGQLDLEALWSGILKRSLRSNVQETNEAVRDADRGRPADYNPFPEASMTF